MLEDVPPDPNVQITPVAGAKTGEPAIIVKSDGGKRVSLLVSDVLQNNSKGVDRSAPSAHGLRRRPQGRAGLQDDVPQGQGRAKRQLTEWAEMPGLARLVPCHGDPVTSGVAEALRAAAAAI